MPIKFEQSSTLKEGPKRLAPFFRRHCPSPMGMYTPWPTELASGSLWSLGGGFFCGFCTSLVSWGGWTRPCDHRGLRPSLDGHQEAQAFPIQPCCCPGHRALVFQVRVFRGLSEPHLSDPLLCGEGLKCLASTAKLRKAAANSGAYGPLGIRVCPVCFRPCEQAWQVSWCFLSHLSVRPARGRPQARDPTRATVLPLPDPEPPGHQARARGLCHPGS